MKRKYRTVGIDLGTTYSALAYIDTHGDSRVVLNPEDQRPVIPSVVFFDGDDVIVGENALCNAHVYPRQVVQCVKRWIGEPHEIEIGKKTWTPEAVSALIVKKLKTIAEPSIGEITDAVITVPAFFNEKRRTATEHAGQIAGINVVATLNEPSAALLACRLHESDSEKIYAVYDLGGGTFDVTVMRVGNRQIHELATGGNRKLGGQDWDEALVNDIADEFVKECGADPREDSISFQSLFANCRDCKRRLTSLQRTTVSVSHAGKVHNSEITRERFEKVTRHLLRRTELTLSACIQEAGVDWSKVEGVVLIGGSTKRPMVRKRVQTLSGNEPIVAADQEQAVAMGAAIYAGVLEAGGPRIAVAGASNDTAQAGTTNDESTRSEDREKIDIEGANVEFAHADDDDDDDDCVEGELELEELQLVNSHGIGVYARKSGNKVNVVMIPRNTKLPTSNRQTFYTSREGMTNLRVTVSEGDNDMREACEVLGKCRMGPLPAGLALRAPVDLELGYDRDGRVRLSASLPGTDTVVNAELEADGLLSQAEVEACREEVINLDIL